MERERELAVDTVDRMDRDRLVADGSHALVVGQVEEEDSDRLDVAGPNEYERVNNSISQKRHT